MHVATCKNQFHLEFGIFCATIRNKSQDSSPEKTMLQSSFKNEKLITLQSISVRSNNEQRSSLYSFFLFALTTFKMPSFFLMQRYTKLVDFSKQLKFY